MEKSVAGDVTLNEAVVWIPNKGLNRVLLSKWLQGYLTKPSEPVQLPALPQQAVRATSPGR